MLDSSFVIFFHYLIKNDGYNYRGWIKWQKCSDYTKGKMKLKYVGDPVFSLIDKNLKNGNPVIVKVFIHKIIPHWVLISGKKGFEYYINDPLSDPGKTVKLSHYGDKMYSLRIFKHI